MDRQEDVLVGCPANRICDKEELPAKGVRVSEEVGAGELDREDKEDQRGGVRCGTHQFPDLSLSAGLPDT
jgi:hypothetical protein